MEEAKYIEIKQKIGENFKKIRKRKKLSLRQVEAITGIDHSWVGKFEKGKINFEIDTLTNLADELGIQLKEFFDF